MAVKILAIFMMCLGLAATPAFARAMPAGTVPPYVQKQVAGAAPVGRGEFNVLFWSLYNATLYAPKGVYTPGKPLALQLEYLRHLDGVKIADASRDEMKKIGMTDDKKLAAWHAQMLATFKDVEKGTRLTGIYTAKGQTLFYRDGVKIGTFTDPDFGRWFFGIWLDPKASYPAFRKVLLGQGKAP